MKSKTEVVRTWYIEELTEGELEIIVEWARIARLAQQNEQGRGWSKDEQLLAEEFKSMLSEGEGDREEIRVWGEKEEDDDAVWEEQIKSVERGDYQKGKEVDTGEGMIWTERD